jgi:mRNA interferase RelE/StbE
VAYDVVIEPRAEKDLHQLRHHPHYGRIRTAALALGEDPRPPGCKKLSIRDSWRIRAGGYRIIYEIADVVRVVTIQRVRKRDEAYDD